jgi:HlyD family secretion protein
MKPKSLLSRRLGLALSGVLLLGAFAFVVLRSGPLAPTRVTVVKAEQGTLAPELFGIGTVEARRAWLIGPTAAGRVLRVLADVGDSVKAGQLLAELDPVDLDERLAALDASVARATSSAAALEAQRKDALARKDLAAINARRYTDLAAQSFVSSGTAEGKLLELTSAEAAVGAAEATLAAARQDVQRLAAERDALRRQRANLRLLAPGDGVVSTREAEAGSTVVAGQAVLRLIDPASLWVRTRFDQGRSAGLALGLPARVALRSNPRAALAGKVARVEAVGDSVTEERIAQVAFERIPAGVAVGELAEVTLALPATAPAVVLPGASIKRQGEQLGVWQVQDGSVRFVPVRLGVAALDGRVQVLEGLSAGAEVVAYSENVLGAKTRVKIVPSLQGAAR